MRPVHRIVAALGALLVLAACGTTNPSPGPVSDILVPRPAPVTMQQPSIMVVNRENLAEFNALVESGQVVIAMPLVEFNKIVQNNQQLLVFIANQDAVIDTYEARIISEIDK